MHNAMVWEGGRWLWPQKHGTWLFSIKQKIRLVTNQTKTIANFENYQKKENNKFDGFWSVCFWKVHPDFLKLIFILQAKCLAKIICASKFAVKAIKHRKRSSKSVKSG